MICGNCLIGRAAKRVSSMLGSIWSRLSFSPFIFKMPGRNEYIRRIIVALRSRVSRILQSPPIPEIKFIEITGNHGQFRQKLITLGHRRISDDIEKQANHVGLCWFRLALEHLEDARHSFAAGRRRATFSRCYYAAYNASKATRYIARGVVSLKGDDHPKASSDLPDDFPDVDKWSEIVTRLFEHRLRADYDNWNDTAAENTLAADDGYVPLFVEHCEAVAAEIDVRRHWLASKNAV
jgi:hypothetical protein